MYLSALHLDEHTHTHKQKHNKSCILCRVSTYWLRRWRDGEIVIVSERRHIMCNRIKRQREKDGPIERGRKRAAISCSLVLRGHIYSSLISNALVNFLSLFIASTCDLCLAAWRKKEKVLNWLFILGSL